MEKKKEKKSKKWLLTMIGMIIVAVVIILLLFGLGERKGDRVKISVTPKTTLSADVRSLLLKSGETKQITVSCKEKVIFSSSDPNVATVNQQGVVKAVSKGNAIITATYDEQTVYCGVIVDGIGNMVDVSKQKAKVIFADVQLEEPGAFTGLAVDTSENAYYLAQAYATSSYERLPSDIVVSKVAKDKGVWKTTEWMRFYESGTGRVAVEKDGADTYLLTESNGSYYGSGTTLSRIGWKNESYEQDTFGETFTFEEVKGSASPAVDTKNGLIMLYDNAKKSYQIYDRKSLQDGKTAVCLHEVVCANNQQPESGLDDSQGFYNATVRDFAIADGYIYQISGSSSIYISVFDLNGILQYCYRVPDYADMEVRMPGGIVCEEGKIYIAVGSGNKDYLLGNVWMFQ